MFTRQPLHSRNFNGISTIEYFISIIFWNFSRISMMQMIMLKLKAKITLHPLQQEKKPKRKIEIDQDFGLLIILTKHGRTIIWFQWHYIESWKSRYNILKRPWIKVEAKIYLLSFFKLYKSVNDIKSNMNDKEWN